MSLSRSPSYKAPMRTDLNCKIFERSFVCEPTTRPAPFIDPTHCPISDPLSCTLQT